MNFHLLHNLSGFAILLSLLAKIIIHLYLDYYQGRNISLGSIIMMPLLYLKPYRYEVRAEYLNLKTICNTCLVIAGISLFLNIIFGVLLI
jgi:hypothetical protein